MVLLASQYPTSSSMCAEQSNDQMNSIKDHSSMCDMNINASDEYLFENVKHSERRRVVAGQSQCIP